MGIKEREEEQANIFNKIIAENFPNLKKELSIQVQKTSKTPNSFDQNRIFPWNTIIKATSTENRERILKAIREKTNNT
jgi:hypothetical protein